MTKMETSAVAVIDISDLGFEEGAHILVRRALERIPAGSGLQVFGSDADLSLHLEVWCRKQGHRFCNSPTNSPAAPRNGSPPAGLIVRGAAPAGRWAGAEKAGEISSDGRPAVVDHPRPSWGLAARGATIEAGTPEFFFSQDTKAGVWAEEAGRIYGRAVASQWDPETDVDWNTPMEHSQELEDAVIQIMTYLIENENAALLVPARFLGQIHPHFKEVLQVLAIQVADEARHIEVFTRRALLYQKELGLSTIGGQASLKTLFEESDFAVASFLLSVLGEGTFINLLQFLQDYGPDPVTRRITQLAGQDEARHVAFGMAHLRYHLKSDPELRRRLAGAIERRHETLANTGGLNEEVYDALVVLAAGSYDTDAIRRGFHQVKELEREMQEGRQRRLKLLGFDDNEAEKLAALHTRNFM